MSPELGHQTMNQKVVILSVEDLGFSKGALTREIIGSDHDQDLLGNPAPFTCGRGRELGLDLCLPEVAPVLILKLKNNQSTDEAFYIAMVPIVSLGEPKIFALINRSGEFELTAISAGPDACWGASDMFVFSLP